MFNFQFFNLQFQRTIQYSPVEVSSKIPVGRYRSVVPVKNLKGRDPRFESFAGHLNLGHVQNAYKFVSDLEKQEQKSLQKALKREKDPDRRFEIEKKLTRMVCFDGLIFFLSKI